MYDVVAELDAFLSQGPAHAVALTGGEPLLELEACERFVRHAKERSPATHVRIYSNGNLATPAALSRLARAGLDEFRIGLKLDDTSGLPRRTSKPSRPPSPPSR